MATRQTRAQMPGSSVAHRSIKHMNTIHTGATSAPLAPTAPTTPAAPRAAEATLNSNLSFNEPLDQGALDTLIGSHPDKAKGYMTQALEGDIASHRELHQQTLQKLDTLDRPQATDLMRASLGAHAAAGLPPDPKVLQTLIATDANVARQVVLQVLRQDMAMGRAPDTGTFVAFANLDPAAAWEMLDALSAVNPGRAREMMVALHKRGRVPPNFPKEGVERMLMLGTARGKPHAQEDDVA